MIAGKVAAGKSRGITDGEQMPTATSPRWKTACAMSHNVAAAHSPMRRSGARGEDGAQAEAHPSPAGRGNQAARGGRTNPSDRPLLQRPQRHDFSARSVMSDSANPQQQRAGGKTFG